MKFRVSIRRGAAYGATLWLAYGVVESWMLGIVPWLQQPVYTYRPLHPGLTALLFAVYAIAGAVSGACAGMATAARRSGESDDARVDELVRAAAVLTLAIAVAANALVMMPSATEFRTPIVSSALVAVAVGLIAARVPGARHLTWLLNPWCAVLLIIGLPWITKELLQLASRPVKLVAVLAWWIAVPAVTSIGQRLGRLRSPGVWTAAIATFLLTVVMRNGPRIDATREAASMSGRSAPSIVLITMDTVRADHLPLYGYRADTAPSLTALASRATLYAQAMSASDTTLASHASMFSGLYPSEHGAHNERESPAPRPLDAAVPMLAAQLAASGYHTMAVVANYGNLGTGLGLDRGFQYYDQRGPVRFLMDDPPHHHFLRQGASRILQRVTRNQLAEVPYRRADDINRAVLPLIDQLKTEQRPFFLFVNYMDAHWPYRPPSPFDTKFGGTRARSISRAEYYRMADEVMAQKRTVTASEWADLESQYDGGIANVDHHIGELIDRLEKLGLFDDSLVIVTADHGEAFGDHGLVEHGVSVYEDQIHVPLIVKYPRQHAPRAVHDAVSGVDVMATVLDVAGRPIPAGAKGRSLARERESSTPARVVFSESFPDAGLYDTNPRFRRIERAVVSDGVKLIVSTAGKRELYDLADPEDRHNLADLRPDVVERLDHAVNQWLATVKQPDGVVHPLDPMTIERLKSLGYVR